MIELVLIAMGAGFALTGNWLYHGWRRAEDRRRHAVARAVLAEHGLTPRRYSAFAGDAIADDRLRHALAAFEETGYLILDRHEQVVGGLLPQMVRGKPQLRLVVSNDDPERVQ